MASKAFYYDIDLKKNKVLNAKLHPLSTAERTALVSTLNSNDIGMMVYDTNQKLLYSWDGNQWASVSLTADQLQTLTESYNGLVRSVGVTSTETTKTILLTTEDGTVISGTFNDSYIHTQTIQANQWIVNHNLNKYPAVTVVNNINVEVVGEIVYTSTNQVILTFSQSFTGKAFFT